MSLQAKWLIMRNASEKQVDHKKIIRVFLILSPLLYLIVESYRLLDGKYHSELDYLPDTIITQKYTYAAG
ncbi:hypothetical protein HBA_0379 [Sodalis endosymbiont of Henestaris halophilus]|nr:hypothetical protein HBA_0379 [Sodalis endosymbiont of Henestaris halophilus]